MRGVEQVPWLYDAGLALIEKTGLARWRWWLASGVPSGRVLDLGCGTGRNLPLFSGGVRAIGVDPCLEVLRRARQRAPGVPLVLARAEALPFRDRSFDTVVSGLAFCSVADVPRGLSEVRRVLDVSGVLRMLEHVRSRRRATAWVQDRVQPAWTWFSGGCRPNRDTEAAVVAAGFAIEQATYRSRGAMRRFEARPRWPEGVPG